MMDDITTNAPAPKPRSHWRSFGLRTLLVVVLLFQVPLIWFTYARQRVEREKQAVMALAGTTQFANRAPKVYSKALGCMEYGPKPWLQERLEPYGAEGYVYPVNYLGASERSYDATFASHLANLPALDTLHLFECNFSADACLPGKGLQKLTILNISRSKPPPALLSSVRHCPRLERLLFFDSVLSPESCSALGAVDQVPELYLHGSELPDCDWSFLAGMSRLEYLSLYKLRGTTFPLASVPLQLKCLVAIESTVSAANLKPNESNSLEKLELSGTPLTKADLMAICGAFPKLRLIYILDTGVTQQEQREVAAAFPTVRFTKDGVRHQ
jgi:hypothetical protein